MKKEHKIPVIRVIRRAVQAAAFVLAPGLFIMVFSALKQVYTALIGGTFSFAALSSQLLLLLAVIPITALMGRFFCGFLCAFGTMGDFFWFLSPKWLKRKVKISEKTDRVLKGLKYFLLAAIVVFVWTFSLISLPATANPWTIFGMYSTVSGWSSTAYLLSLGGALLLLIILGSMLVERFFCRYLCPLGAVFVPLSRIRAFRIKKPKKDCGACKFCSRNCPMGISLYRMDSVASGECIDCFACIETCPRGNVSANPAPPVAAAAAIVAITGLTYAGNLFAQDAEAYTETASVQVIGSGMNCGQYADGTYTGSASGYKGTTTVQVTVENGYITGVEVLSTDDDREFFNMAESSIIAGVLRTQSTDVDTVTGATFSSNAILNAVSDALGTMGSCNSNMLDAGSLGEETNASAAGNGTGANGSAASAEEETNAAAAEIEVSNLEDGVYSGTGTGFRGAITVSVTVSDGKITDITVVSQQEDREYFDRAEDTMISRVLSAQSVDVDTVSGATYSSDGILEAVADALGQTYESSSPAAEASQHGGGHGRRA